MYGEDAWKTKHRRRDGFGDFDCFCH
jgi:hypothetical protein